MKNWLYKWQREGSEMAHWWLIQAWDKFRADGHGYDVLVVAMPLNFVVRAAYLARWWCLKHARYGSREAWVRGGRR